MQGHGTLNYGDGRKYEGDFHANLRSGQGAMDWPDGRRYVGAWKEGKQHGKGIMIENGKVVQDGSWAHGQFYKAEKVKPKLKKTSTFGSLFK